MRMHRLAGLVLCAAALAGCGDDAPDDALAGGTTPPTPTPTASPSGSPTPSPTPTAAPEPPLGPGSRIGVEGAGDVRAGTTVREAEALTGLTFTVEGFEDFGGRCYYATPEGLEEQLTFMVVSDARPADPKDGTIGRASSDQSMGEPAATVSGIRVGDTAERVRQVYGDRLTSSPHTYQEHGEYLEVDPRDASLDGFLLRMEIGDSGLVEQVHGGLAGVVQAPEGCA